MTKIKYRTKRIEEFRISGKVHQQIQFLLKQSFSEYPEGRSYYQQVPSFRYLVYDDKTLIGHMAVEHRIINVDEEVVSIFGIGDFCIHPEYQSKQIASKLLEELEVLAIKYRIDFLVLVAQEHGFYKKHGFSLKKNTCRWLMITNRKTLGIGHRNISESLMAKAIGAKQWKKGLVDFLGPIF